MEKTWCYLSKTDENNEYLEFFLTNVRKTYNIFIIRMKRMLLAWEWMKRM